MTLVKKICEMNIRPQLTGMWQGTVLGAVLALTVSACTNVPLQQGASLSSYANMTESGGTLTKANLRVDSAQVLAAQTVRIVPTSIQIGRRDDFNAGDLSLVTNTVDRALCAGLSNRFAVVAANQPADLTVHATITNIVATNGTAAAISTAATLGVAATVHIPAPRLPIGLGGLSIEAEAIGRDGSQKAAMLWARGANMITTGARASAIGDAYSLSSEFGTDFSRLLITGKDPFKQLLAVPSMQDMKTAVGGDPKFDACKIFGRAPGVTGALAGGLGLPPGWSDKGSTASQ